MTRLIDFNEVKHRTGNLSAVTYWRLRRAGKFPEPVAVSANRKAWNEADIDAWVNAKTAGGVSSPSVPAAQNVNPDLLRKTANCQSRQGDETA